MIRYYFSVVIETIKERNWFAIIVYSICAVLSMTAIVLKDDIMQSIMSPILWIALSPIILIIVAGIFVTIMTLAYYIVNFTVLGILSLIEKISDLIHKE